MRKSVWILFLLSVFLSCKKDPVFVPQQVVNTDYACPVSGITGVNKDVFSKWKLVETHVYGDSTFVFTPGPLEVRDYSCEEVIFEFTRSGQLRILSGHADFSNQEQSYRQYEGPMSVNPISFQLDFTLSRKGIERNTWIARMENNGSFMLLKELATYRVELKLVRIEG